MPKKLSIRDVNFANKKVLVRVDFNVPLDKKTKNITDDTRIRAAIPTIEHLVAQGAVVVLASHLGRPDGERKPEYSLAPVAARLADLLKKEIRFLDDCIGDSVKAAIRSAKSGDVLLLENVRFYGGEEKNDPEFARQLADGLDCLVNDAFGTAHRGHASNKGVTKYLSPAVAGLLLEKELEYFGKVIDNPERPLVAILGGAKVSGKLQVINNLMKKVDKLLIGGGMMFTFLKAKGLEVGSSLVEDNLIDTAKDILNQAEKAGMNLLLPIDCVVADKFEATANSKLVNVENIPSGWLGLDIGPASIQLFADALNDAKTVVWNGPMGVFEMEAFSKGTVELAAKIAASNAVSIIGGGDTVAAIEKAGVSEKMSFISTGGGASLELLEGKDLPGVSALTNK
ncbi:phosphoglycerate kinase, chloroplastic [Candidatus Moduliflexus flocculans]|uniref:Phosphoglycerate kinase n=1 Tax=Candidatus Moduliflexus flocculans TaxID=1499966 RepID=A0A0S6W338_9BACT|nr:phosphoglycerate kinase, chloroplastic [Candidatus Moduliflexus flocculans]